MLLELSVSTGVPATPSRIEPTRGRGRRSRRDKSSIAMKWRSRPLKPPNNDGPGV